MFFARLLVKSIAPKVHIKKSTDGTEFEWETNTVYYDNSDDPFDKCFNRHLKEKHLFDNPEKYSFRLWSLLHELGHYFNQDVEEDFNAKMVCATMSKEFALENITLQDMYYDSPDEFTATEWAIEWVVCHPKLAKLFSKLL